MNKKNFIAVAVSLLLPIFWVAATHAHGFGDDSSGGGGHASYPNCDTTVCTRICGGKNEMYKKTCPHWILAPISVFKKAVDETRAANLMDIKNEDAIEICTDKNKNVDGYVVFSGNYLPKGNQGNYHGVGNPRYYNFSPFVLTPKKTSHYFMEYVDPDGETHWRVGNDGTKWDFLNKDNQKKLHKQNSGDNYTYRSLMEEIAKRHNVSEEELSFFCYGMVADTKNTYYVRSRARSAESGSNKTDYITYVTKFAERVSTHSTLVGNSVSLIFNHNIFANVDGKNVNWEVIRTMNGGSGMHARDGYTIKASKVNSTGSTSGRTTGKSNITDNYNPGANDDSGAKKQVPKNERKYKINGSSFIHRDEYSIKFTKAGTYTFCERIMVTKSSSNYPRANTCVTFVVREKSASAQICPNSGRTTIDILQKNNNVDNYKNFTSGLIYAKPGDKIDYKYSYCAGVQAMANKLVSVKDEDGYWYNTLFRNAVVTLEGITWGNSFGIAWPKDKKETHTYAVGYEAKSDKTHDYSVATGDVGATFSSKITSSVPSSASVTAQNNPNFWANMPLAGTPYGSSPTRPWTYYEGKFNKNPVSKEVKARVPYNYVIKDGDPQKGGHPSNVNFSSSSPIPSGGSFTVYEANVGVNTLHSNSLNQSYATKTQAAVINLYLFTTTGNSSVPTQTGNVQVLPSYTLCNYYGSPNCRKLDTSNATSLNSNSALSGYTDKFFQNKSYRLPDLKAGTNICLAYEVSLAQSHSDPNSNDTNGRKYISKASCRVVAKKPSATFWGGNIYSSGSIATSITTKSNISGIAGYEYTNSATSPTRTFGSWGEYGVISNGAITGLSSAAATGFPSVTVMGITAPGSVAANPGGSPSSNTCSRNHLTFSNSSCQLEILGNANIPTNSSLKDSILSRFVSKADSKNIAGSVYLSESNFFNLTGSVRRTYSDTDLIVRSNAPLPRGITHIIYSDRNISIRSNLKIQDTYNKSSEIPQYLIYAKGSITIDCTVTELDAVLITDGEINTCDDPDVNSKQRSTHLKIRGYLIANKLTLNRSYGSAPGINSIVPAEIIDLTPASFLWSSSQAGSENDDLHPSYTRELAPRY